MTISSIVQLEDVVGLPIVLLAAVLAGVVVAVAAGPGGAQSSPRRIVLTCLAALIISLQIVGVVSHTIVRHIVQCIPPAIVWVLIYRGSMSGIAGAAPIFTFWTAVVIVIWLFLLDIVRLMTGTFTSTEIAMTIVMGVACVGGTATIARSRSSLSTRRRVLVAIACGIGQFAAMVLSFLPPFR